MSMFFVKAMKGMIWHALEAINEPNQNGNEYKQSKLLVFTHNLANTGNIPFIKEEFENQIPNTVEKVTSEEYMKVIDAVTTKVSQSRELIKTCLETTYNVCWDIYFKVKIQNSGLPPLMTETSAKIWWRLFNVFADREADNLEIQIPVRMDWEEIDYWVNVALKTMALPTNFTRKDEKDIMGWKSLNFEDALKRFNLKLNDHDGIYVYESDAGQKVDKLYIEQSLLEIQDKVFQGIYMNGYLGKCKKSAINQKWCTLTRHGLHWGDTDSQVFDPKNSLTLTLESKIEHSIDKLKRPIRFQISNKDKEVLVFESTNAATRNKWFTALLCVRDNKMPLYDNDFTDRKRNRRKLREQEKDIKEKIKQQKAQTKAQMEELNKKLVTEQEKYQEEQSKLQAESAEQLRERVLDFERRMQEMKSAMNEMEQRHRKNTEEMETDHQNALQSQEIKFDEEKIRLRTERENSEKCYQTEIQELQEKLNQLQDSKESLNQSKNAEIEALKAEKENEKNAMLSENQLLKQQLHEADDKHEQMVAKVAEQEAVIETLKKQNEKDQLTLKQKEEEYSENKKALESKLAAAEKTNNEFEEKLDQGERTMNRLREEMTKASAGQREAEDRAGREETQVKTLTEEVKKLSEQLKNQETLQINLHETAVMLDKQAAICMELEATQKELQQEIVAKNIIIQDQQKEQKKTIEAMNSLQNKFEKLTSVENREPSHRGDGFKATVKHLLDSTKKDSPH